jgi:hypothetical protein
VARIEVLAPAWNPKMEIAKKCSENSEMESEIGFDLVNELTRH